MILAWLTFLIGFVLGCAWCTAAVRREVSDDPRHVATAKQRRAWRAERKRAGWVQ